MKEKSWDSIWKNYHGLNFLGKMHKKSQFNMLDKITKMIRLDKKIKIIDCGCGAGHTLNFFRMLGYKNSIGTDISKNAINLCNKNYFFIENNDVFNIDIIKSKKFHRKFDMVFSDGMIEHFKETDSISKALCDISKKWILLFQPNHFSLLGKIKEVSEKLGKSSWEKEYDYSKEDYERMFLKNGFKLTYFKNFHYGESFCLLFRRVSK
jgi:cyclopropane fatty-acyl-phospholipid synthase-like methyltransferase